MWPIERRRRFYSPECVEGVSLLKNLLHARFVPRLGAKRASFGGFRARFVVAISSGRLFQQAGVFSEVGLPLYGVLRSPCCPGPPPRAWGGLDLQPLESRPCKAVSAGPLDRPGGAVG